jgi:hypothetical protein
MSTSPSRTTSVSETGVGAGRTWWIAGLGLLGLSIFVGLVITPASNAGFKDAAAVITFATLVAVGIERGLEIGWTLLDNTALGGYWPMSIMKRQITEAETITNDLLGPVLTQTRTALNTAKGAAAARSDEADMIRRQIERLDQAAASAIARMTLAQSLAPGSTRVASVSGAASTVTSELRSALKMVGSGGGDAQTLLDVAEIKLGSAIDVIGSFQDNPFRRLTSLMLGAAAGTLVTSFVGVNLFAAISTGGDALKGALGVVVTGMVVGLGSGPTHELVKSLQANKNSGQLLGVPSSVLAPVGATGPGSRMVEANVENLIADVDITGGERLAIIDAMRAAGPILRESRLGPAEPATFRPTTVVIRGTN